MTHAELKFTGEGVSLSMLDEDGRLVDEAWYTWAEVADFCNDEDHVSLLLG